MTLRCALDRLSADRDTQLALRDVLTYLRLHQGEWIRLASIQQCSHGSPPLVNEVLGVLSSCYVVDSDGDPPQYVFRSDRLIDFEIERFLRRAETQTTRLRNNVERFRNHYGH